MSQGTQQNAHVERLTQISKNLPAVALVATADNTDWITGEILHAHQNGHQALVTSKADANLEALEYARMLGAQVIEPPSDLVRTAEPKERLRKFAQEEGYPGLLYHSHGAERIDLQASYEALKASKQFAVDASLQPAVDQEPSVLVGIPGVTHECYR